MLSYLSSVVRFCDYQETPLMGVFWLAIPRGRDNFLYVITFFQNIRKEVNTYENKIFHGEWRSKARV